MSYRITSESRGANAVAALDADDDLRGPGPRPGGFRQVGVRPAPPLSVQAAQPLNYGRVQSPTMIRVPPPSYGPIRVSPSLAPVRLGPNTVRVPARQSGPKGTNQVMPSRVMPIPGALPADVIITMPNGASSTPGHASGGGGSSFTMPSSASRPGLHLGPIDLPDDRDLQVMAPKKSHLPLILAGAGALGLIYYLTRKKAA